MGPGSTHLVADLYDAARDHAPVLALSGDMPRKLRRINYIQSTEPDLLFRDVSLYTETVSSPAQAPRVVHQAIAAAYAGRGVAHLTLPQDVIAASAEGSVPSVVTLKPPAERVANDDDIEDIATKIDIADHVVIPCRGGCHGAADELRALSDRLEAPLIHSVKGKDIMPYDDAHWMGGIGMIRTRAAYDAVMNCDLLLMVGTDFPYSEFLPGMTVVVQIDERPQALGVVGSARPTFQLLQDRVAAKSDRRFWDRIVKERRKWDDMLDKQADLARSTNRVHPQAAARMVSDLAAPEFRAGQGQGSGSRGDLWPRTGASLWFCQTVWWRRGDRDARRRRRLGESLPPSRLSQSPPSSSLSPSTCDLAHRVDHVKQTGCGILDVEMLVLARTAFRRQQTAAVDLLEIAVGELVPLLGLLALLIVYAQAPLAVFGVAVPLDERVLLVGGWAVFAPVIPHVELEPARADKLLRVFERNPV